MKAILAMLLALLPMPGQAQEPALADVQATWITSIASRMRSAQPHNMDLHYSTAEKQTGCLVDIQLLTDGLVFDVVFPEPCSPDLENAIRWVIHGVQPLPLPADMAAYQSRIRIRFRPTHGS